MVFRCMMLLVATAPMAACTLDGDEVLGAERERPVPYPERLYMPRPRSAEEVARERTNSAPTQPAQDGGADAGIDSRR